MNTKEFEVRPFYRMTIERVDKWKNEKIWSLNEKTKINSYEPCLGGHISENYWKIYIKRYHEHQYARGSRHGSISTFLECPDEEDLSYIKDYVTQSIFDKEKESSQVIKLMLWLDAEFSGNVPSKFGPKLRGESWLRQFKNFEGQIYDLEQIICETLRFNGFVYNKHTTLKSLLPHMSDEHEYLFYLADGSDYKFRQLSRELSKIRNQLRKLL